jgi:hypothetical protein
MKPSDKLSGMWCLIESCWVKIDFRRFLLYVWTCQLLKLRSPSLSSWHWHMTLQTELWYCCTLSSKTLIAVQHRFVSSQLSICGRAVDALSCSCLYVYWKSYVTLAICCWAEQLCPSTFRGKFVLDLCLLVDDSFCPS